MVRIEKQVRTTGSQDDFAFDDPAIIEKGDELLPQKFELTASSGTDYHSADEGLSSHKTLEEEEQESKRERIPSPELLDSDFASAESSQSDKE